MRVRAIQIAKTGGPEELKPVDLELGDPGSGEIRVRHHAVGVNFLDTYHRTGLYKLPLPAVLGTEGAGVVDAVGPGVTNVAVGDRIAYATRTPGSYAEARVIPAMHAMKLPAAIDFDTGAAMMLKGMTVEYLLRRTLPPGGLHAGDPIVWHAAAGGVGLIACQWAKALGLVLIGTAGSDAKCELARQAGAAHVINYRKEDVVARVHDITKGAGVKVVYDSVGKDTWERSLDCLAPFGLMVSYGNASGPVPPVTLTALSPKSLYVTRPTLMTHIATFEQTTAIANELFAMVASGKVEVAVQRRYPLAEAARAHRDLEARATTGASVLVP
jgi:NADPH2:quinone reductase